MGIVSSLTPHQDPKTGRVTAIANLKLEKSVEPLPADTTRERAVGLGDRAEVPANWKRARPRQTIKAGGTIPLSQTREPVDIEELFNMFDEKTRTAIKINTNNFGDGLAGRGLGLNNTIAELRPLVTNAIPVLHNLAAPQTGLRELFVALDRVASQSGARGRTPGQLLQPTSTHSSPPGPASPARSKKRPRAGRLARTGDLLAAPRGAASIEKRDRIHAPAAPERAPAASRSPPPLGHAFTVGAVNLARRHRAEHASWPNPPQALAEFAENPVVTARPSKTSPRRSKLGNPVLAGIAPEQANCNYLTLAFRNVASLRVREHRRRHAGPRRASCSRRPAPTTRAIPPRRPPTAVDRTKLRQPGDHRQQPPARQPLPERQPARASRQVCEAGNETYIPGKAVIGNAAGAQRHEQPRIHDARTEPVRRKVPAPRRCKALGLSAEPRRRRKGKRNELCAWWRRHDEIPVVELQRTNPVRFGVVLIVDRGDRVYFGFTKQIPFKHGFRLKAVFATAVNIHPKSPVRIAGVNVGKVSSIKRDGQHRRW